jgi:hypothetical protein
MQHLFGTLRVLPVLALAVVTGAAGPAAAADLTGTAGVVTELVLNGESSEAYGVSHGSVRLQEGDSVASIKREYKWGGTSCAGVLPSEEQKRLLFEAMRAGFSIQVVPSYRMGLAGARCLVGIRLRLRPPPA